jgi:uncharacterized protein YkwD
MLRSGLQLAARHLGDGPTREIAAATFSLLVSLLAINGVAAKDFEPVGGPGDYLFGALCPANQFLVGLTVKSGAWVDQMAIICAPVNPDGSTGSPWHDPKHYGGDGGGAPTQKTCAPGQLINHMGFSLTAGNRQVLFFHFGCHSTTNNQTGTFELGASSSVFPSINQDCPNGEVGRGIAGRAGKHVNAVGLLCGPPPSVKVAGGGGTPTVDNSLCLPEKPGQVLGQLLGLKKCPDMGGSGFKISESPSQFAQGDKQAALSREGVLCLIEAERNCRGLPGLRRNHELEVAASGHARAAVQIKWWVGSADSHTNPQTGSTPTSRIKAAGYCPNPPHAWGAKENTYHGAGVGKYSGTNHTCPGSSCGSPEAAVDWWMNISHSGHRETILDPQLKEFGFAAMGEVADPAIANVSPRGLYVLDFGFCD